MTKTFYISDTHFEHTNIIRLCERPFSDVDDMNKTMVDRWNSAVTDDDVVYHLGDFAWKNEQKWFDQLNGKITFIWGNHDHESGPVNENSIYYREVKEYVPELGNIKIVLFHYPIVEWNGMFKGWFHFYGHVHTNPLNDMPLNWKARAFNVGAEFLDYTPRTAEEIIMKGNR